MIRFDNDHNHLAVAVRKAIEYLGYILPPGHNQAYRLEETAGYCCGPYDSTREKGWYWKVKLALTNWLLAWQHRLNAEVIRSLRQVPVPNAPAGKEGWGNRPRVAFLVPYDVSENINGGSARAWGICRALASDYQVVLLTVAGEHKRSEHRWITSNVELLTFPIGTRLAKTVAESEGVLGRAAGLLTVLDRASEIPFLAAYLRQCGSLFSAILLDGPYLFPLVNELCPGVQLVYNCNDVTTDYLRRLLEGKPSDAVLRRVEDVEHAVIQCAAGVVMVSEADRAELCRNYEGLAVKSALVANAIDVDEAQALVPTQAERLAREVGLKRRLVVFVGSVLQVNIHAMAFVIEHLAPKFPGELFVIIGVSAASFFARYRRLVLPENVVFAGTVAASVKEAVMALCSVAIAPMADGTGSSLKIPDYLAHGKPVVATTKAMRGYESLMPEVHLAELDGFAVALKAALDEVRDRGAEVDARAARLRDVVKQHFDWSVTSQPILTFLAGAIRR